MPLGKKQQISKGVGNESEHDFFKAKANYIDMLKIFAKYGTDEKIAVYCRPTQIRVLQLEFRKQFGGEWLLVDECMIGGEILKFQDGRIYRGFEPEQSDDYRYSNAIKRFKISK